MKPHFAPPHRPNIKPISPDLTPKELILMIIAIIIATFISFIPIIPTDEPLLIFSRLLIFAIIIFASVIAKRFAANRYALRIEHTFWEFSRWWFLKRSYLKRPVPLGLILPFVLGLFTLGALKPFTFFQFNAQNLPHIRRLRAVGHRRALRKEAYFINETDLGYTAAAGFYTLLALALIGAIISAYFENSFTMELTKFALYYGIWNLLPLSNLDGAKLFFGVFYGWVFITALYIISLVGIVVF